MICAGGGGIPTMYEPGADRKLVGVEAVIDKDACSELLAREVEADLFVMATDAEAVFLDCGTPKQRAIHRAQSDGAAAAPLPGRLDGTEGRGGLPVRAGDGHTAAIGALADIAAIVRGEKGTLVDKRFAELSFHA